MLPYETAPTMSKVAMVEANANCTLRFDIHLVFSSPELLLCTVSLAFNCRPVACRDELAQTKMLFLAVLQYVIDDGEQQIKKFSCWCTSGHHLWRGGQT